MGCKKELTSNLMANRRMSWVYWHWAHG